MFDIVYNLFIYLCDKNDVNDNILCVTIHAAPSKGTIGNQSGESYTFLEAVNFMLFSQKLLKLAAICYASMPLWVISFLKTFYYYA